MGLFDFLKRLFGGPADGPPVGTLPLAELARRTQLSEDLLKSIPIGYRRFTIPKRNGARREILAPGPELKQVQRALLRRLLGRLKAHPAAVGFERGHSIVTHATWHSGAAIVVRVDIRDFFTSTTTERVEAYFGRIGWNREATSALTRLCTFEGGLPQGAPTSPRLSNLVNHRMDARLAAVAARHGARYSRYADDITFSLRPDQNGKLGRPNALIGVTRIVLEDYGYALQKRKQRVMRRHHQQRVTGLVVNDGVNLPRTTRRRLRAIEHHLRVGKRATLTREQYAGWVALRRMLEAQ